jgi:thymidylate synthase
MDHIIEQSMLFHELNDNESSDTPSKSSLISGGSIRRIRKLTPEEEDAYRKKLALKNEIYGTGKVSERIFSNIKKYEHEEYQYLNLLENILENGFWEEGRNGKTKSIFGASMRFSLKDGKIPILTTKKTAWKTCLKELLWFIRGDTDNKILKSQGVHIWDANASREFLDSRGLKLYPEDMLGPIYGYQWRDFGASYNCFTGKKLADADGVFAGVDQLQQIIDALKDPKQRTSRRLIMTAWNPKQLDQMALPPCHILCQFNVHDGNKLSCALYQRSGDFPLGIPFNIASYSFFTHLIAKHCGLEAYEFVHFVGNCHIYEDHIEPMKEQIQREPFEFPILSIKQIRENISDYQVEDFEVHNYKSHEAIKMKMVA